MISLLFSILFWRAILMKKLLTAGVIVAGTSFALSPVAIAQQTKTVEGFGGIIAKKYLVPA
jgi:hypothetical protein